MFTRLRNRFLILNMSVTSLLMIAALAVIYFITSHSLQSEIDVQLRSQAEKPLPTVGESLPGDTEPGGTVSVAQTAPFDLIDIEVDRNGKVLTVYSRFQMPKEAYLQAAAIAWSSERTSSTFTLEGRQWRYVIVPPKDRATQGNQSTKTDGEAAHRIAFFDVTEANRAITRLLKTSVLVGFVMLLFVFLISLLFANRAIRPIAETWDRQRRFVADASHELRTPLSIINANCDVLLANRDQTVGSLIKWLGYIRLGADRMTRLVNDLLALASMDDARSKVEKVPFDISSAVTDLTLAMEAAMNEKSIILSHSIEPGLIITSDPERVRQVVSILLDNAVKYADEHGKVDVALRSAKGHVTFTVTNSGQGIAAGDLPRVFDRFYRVDSARTNEGSGYGLGLSIAKAIIARLGGAISARSVEGQSTTFTFTLEAR